jgi:hypothetical protein
MNDLHEVVALRRANARLADRARLHDAARRTEAIRQRADAAYLDALHLITLHVGGGDVGRRTSGLPQRRWAQAVALLRLAGLAHGRYVVITPKPTPAATLAALQEAHRRAVAQPQAWGAYVPAYTRPRALQRGDRRNDRA